jgi:hypothetical protein
MDLSSAVELIMHMLAPSTSGSSGFTLQNILTYWLSIDNAAFFLGKQMD